MRVATPLSSMKKVLLIAFVVLLEASLRPCSASCTAAYLSREDNVRTYYNQIDAGDIDGVIARFADDAVYKRDGFKFQGRAEIEKFFREIRKLKGTHQVTRVTDLPLTNATMVEGEFVGTDNGVPVFLKYYDTWNFNQDGQVIRRHSLIQRL